MWRPRRQRLLEVALLLLYEAEREVGRREMRIQFDSVVALFERRTEVAPEIMNDPHVARDDR